MFQSTPARWLAALSALLALTVSAQIPPAPATAPEIAAVTPNAHVQTAPGQYRSALESYQPYSDTKMVPWKEANDAVGRIGGWRAYAKEAAEAQTPAAPARAASGAADPHAGHGKQ